MTGPTPGPVSGLGNLPAELNGFAGRGDEIAEARSLLRRARLVSVVGIGGVGKSRLARRVAASLAPEFPDGAWLVACSELTDPALLCHAVAEALRLTDGTARPAPEVLREFLAPRRLLLLLDGCEHLVDEAASLLGTLLTAAPGLTVLATTREPLRVEGEHLLQLAPLSTEGPSPDAVTLFAERAAAALPGFAVTAQNREQVTALCRRLDGIPLALELAAGRLAVLSVQQITERLDDRFRLLTGGTRTALPRHQTLRTAIGWSHELCTPQERLLWSRLSVFVGPFDLEAAQYVCAGDGITAEEVLEVLAALVAKSVVQREPGAGTSGRGTAGNGAAGLGISGVGGGGSAEDDARYRMLDTLREYGGQWLRASDADQQLRRRHRDWYLGLATWGEVEWFSPRQLETSARTEAAHSNMRAALEYCLSEPGEEQLALFLVGTLWFFWVGCGHLGEGRVWLDRALDLAPEPTESRAKALWVTGYLSILQGDRLHALALLEECRQQALDTGDDRALAYAVHRQGCAALIADELDRAVELFDEALWHYDQLGELNSNVLMGMFELGLAHTFRGDAATGASWIGKVLSECRRFGERWAYAYGLFASAYAAWSVGDLDRAREQARECVRLNHAFRDLVGLALGVELLALLATEPDDAGAPGDLREAAVLQGAAGTLWLSVGEPLFGSGSFNAAHDTCSVRVRDGLAPAEAAAAFARGTALGLDELVDRALVTPAAARVATAQRPHGPKAVGALREPLAGQRE